MTTLELEERLDNLLSTAQAETANIDLFAPITEREECPICLVPFGLREDDITYMTCCGKNICIGCCLKSVFTDRKNGIPSDKQICALCRQICPEGVNGIKATEKQVKNNNPQAMMQMATDYQEGEGVPQSDIKAIEMYIRAAELGEAEAFIHIGRHYDNVILVQENVPKALEYYEVAAKKGAIAREETEHMSPMWRRLLTHKSIQHRKVLACAGHKESYRVDTAFISKEELTQTLRTYQRSSDELKTDDREHARLVFGSSNYHQQYNGR